MQGRSFTIMLMRDDREVRTFRVSTRSALWLTLGGLALGLAVLSGLSFGVHSFLGEQRLRAERGSLEERLAEVQVQLERRRNLLLLAGAQPAVPAAAAQAERPAEAASGPCALENLSVRRAGGALAVDFDLVNRGGGGEATGTIRMLLVGRDGSAATPDPAEASRQGYRIQRRKHVSAQLRAPGGLALAQAGGLRVEVLDAAGAVVCAETVRLGD